MQTIRSRCFILIGAVSILLLSDRALAFAGDDAVDHRFDAINRQFDAAVKRHDHQLAKRLAYQMIAVKPKNSRGYRSLCRAEAELHNYKAALAAIDTAIKLRNDNPKCLCARARVYAESDQDNLAKLDYKKAITTDTESADFYSGVGAELEQLEDYEGALVAVEKALKLDPGSGKIQNIAGRVLERLNRPLEAEPHLKKAVQLLPHDSEPLRHIAMVHAVLKRPDAVVVDTTGAIKMGNVRGMHLVELYRLRAEALSSLGRLLEARDDYDRCIKISPLQRGLWQARAKLDQQLGDEEGARQDLAKLKSIDNSVQPFNGF